MSEQELQSLKALITVLDEQAFPGTDFYAAVNVAKKMIAEVERLREKMTWLDKGKMRPLEKQYQTYLQHDQDEDYDDTPPDYVEWLEQIAEGDAARPDGT